MNYICGSGQLQEAMEAVASGHPVKRGAACR